MNIGHIIFRGCIDCAPLRMGQLIMPDNSGCRDAVRMRLRKAFGTPTIIPEGAVLSYCNIPHPNNLIHLCCVLALTHHSIPNPI